MLCAGRASATDVAALSATQQGSWLDAHFDPRLWTYEFVRGARTLSSIALPVTISLGAGTSLTVTRASDLARYVAELTPSCLCSYSLAPAQAARNSKAYDKMCTPCSKAWRGDGVGLCKTDTDSISAVSVLDCLLLSANCLYPHEKPSFGAPRDTNERTKKAHTIINTSGFCIPKPKPQGVSRSNPGVVRQSELRVVDRGNGDGSGVRIVQVLDDSTSAAQTLQSEFAWCFCATCAFTDCPVRLYLGGCLEERFEDMMEKGGGWGGLVVVCAGLCEHDLCLAVSSGAGLRRG
jgi:hypothetical protein